MDGWLDGWRDRAEEMSWLEMMESCKASWKSEAMSLGGTSRKLFKYTPPEVGQVGCCGSGGLLWVRWVVVGQVGCCGSGGLLWVGWVVVCIVAVVTTLSLLAPL